MIQMRFIFGGRFMESGLLLALVDTIKRREQRNAKRAYPRSKRRTRRITCGIGPVHRRNRYPTIYRICRLLGQWQKICDCNRSDN